MTSPAAGPLVAVGRFCLTFVFISSLGNKLTNWSRTTEYMAANGMPMPNVMLACACVLLLVGGLSVLLGFQARIGAGMLLLFLLAATYFFHDFWTFDDPAERRMQMIQFMKNLSMGGAMLVVIGIGSGPWSLEALLFKKREEASSHAHAS